MTAVPSPGTSAGGTPDPGPTDGRLAWPGFESAWARLPPHAEESVTGPHQVGVAFSPHRAVTYRVGQRAARTSYAGGSVVCSGAEEIVWTEVQDPTEALEIYPTPELLGSVLGDREGVADPRAGWPVERAVVGVSDPVVLGVAGVLRRAHLATAYVGETAASELGVLLARHLLVEYGGLRLPGVPGRPRLTRAQLTRVADLVGSDLGGPLTLDRLAAEVHLSPYHFAHAFRATVGQPPYAFVSARRMDRARDLLRSTSLSVAEVATAVGLDDSSHFRRVFRAHAGAAPAAYRAGR